jgi:hypothetical protein
MPFLLLVMEQPNERSDAGPEEGRRRYDRMVRYGEDLTRRGVLLGAQSLAGPSSGVRIRRRGGRETLVDGPFAEAKEIVGGFFLLGVESRDEALALAAECPAAEWSTLELRALGPCYDDG